MRKSALILIIAVMTAVLVGCGSKSDDKLKPLIGLAWYDSYDDVKSRLDDRYELIAERGSDSDKEPQQMLDYTGAQLFGTDCDLTLCFGASGLIGLNYHDILRSNTYQQWFALLEKEYGYPTEEGSGMASWYDDPLGKNTSVYLFNLEEGVQVSFYTSASSPDKSFSNGDKEERRANIIYVPTPELRTPVVPVEPETAARTTTAVQTQTVTNSGGEVIAVIPVTPGNDDPSYDSEISGGEETPAETKKAGQSVTTTARNSGGSVRTTATTTRRASGSAATTTSRRRTTITSAVHTMAPTLTTTARDRTGDYRIGGVEFYGTLAAESRKMSGYTKLYEYDVDDEGQPQQHIIEYSGAEYCGRECDAVLCFTSLGLVGINYFDSEANEYSYWVSQLSEIYGTPTESLSDYTIWEKDPLGSGTIIYVFALDDGVQISFFADDTGSE